MEQDKLIRLIIPYDAGKITPAGIRRLLATRAMYRGYQIYNEDDQPLGLPVIEERVHNFSQQPTIHQLIFYLRVGEKPVVEPQALPSISEQLSPRQRRRQEHWKTWDKIISRIYQC